MGTAPGGVAGDPDDGLRRLERLSPFVFHHVIGRGAHGVVYRATDRRSGAEVAVKVLSAPARSPEALLRFTQERLLDLEHPCLVAPLGGVDDGDVACLAMELVAGRTLAEHLVASGPLEPAVAAAVALDVLDGLSHAHAAGVIHRDVKSENVLLDPSCGEVRARLSDFGCALVLDGPRLSLTASPVGTSGYVAPEVLAGGEADERSDLYAVGRLVEAAVGPGAGSPELAAWHAVMTDPSPDARPATAKDAAAMLRGVVEPRPLEAAAVPVPMWPRVAHGRAGGAFPSGTVTFLFSDVEGHVAKWDENPAAMQLAMDHHDSVVVGAVRRHGGRVVKLLGDGCFAVFSAAIDAVEAAAEMQRALDEPQPGGLGLVARVGIHTGSAVERDGDFLGNDVNRAARVMSIAHGGQVLISSSTASLAGGGLDPAGLSLRSLGVHPLRGLSRPEHVHQLVGDGLRAEFPPLGTGGGLAASNLPERRSSFVGRRAELDRLAAELEHGRLVTLVGPGGVGKTSLASQAAQAATEQVSDIWFVDLASISAGQESAKVLADAMGVLEAPDEDLTDRIIRVLGRRSVLLLVDNCEHVVDDAAQLIDVVLRACPAVRVLATSREAIRVDGEAVVDVDPLPLPDGSGNGRSDATDLFVERARSHRTGVLDDADAVSWITRICRRLDGIPLAIELAAARVRSMTLPELHDGLDRQLRLLSGGSRTVPRHETLEALVDWSVGLLTTSERRAFERLGVFPASFESSAAHAVVTHDDPDSDEWDTRATLTALVDKSLLTAATDGNCTRYRMLETVRHYAGERTATEPGRLEQLQAVHRDHFLAGAERLREALDLVATLEWCDREHDNLVAAFDYTMAHVDKDTDAAQRLFTAIEYPWAMRGHAKRLLPLATAVVESPAPPSAIRSTALLTAGFLRFGNDPDRAEACGRAVLDTGREVAGDSNWGEAQVFLAELAAMRGDQAEFERLIDDAAATAAQAGLPHLSWKVRMARGNVHLQRFELDAARLELEGLDDPDGDPDRDARWRMCLTQLELFHGDVTAAARHAEAAAAASRSISDLLRLPSALLLQGVCLSAMGETVAAHDSIVEAIDLVLRTGDAQPLSWALLGCVWLHLDTDDELAARLLGASNRIIDGLGFGGRWSDIAMAEQFRELGADRLREALGADRFEELTAEGCALDEEQAVALARIRPAVA